MAIPIFLVDAFARKPFEGNPAAVVLLRNEATAEWMQNVAMEMNLSETAFVHYMAVGQYGLRWFTPKAEVDLCGHATLASAHAMWQENVVGPKDVIRFKTRSGILGVAKVGEWIAMDFPSLSVEAAKPPAGLLESLGVRPVFVGKSKFDFLIEVENESEVRALRPDFAKLRDVQTRGVTVTAKSSSSEFDFVSRFFAPAVGIDEDPVTGSAHCKLGPYWGAKLGKHELTGFQASSRGGVVRIKLNGERVELMGQAITVTRGELT